MLFSTCSGYFLPSEAASPLGGTNMDSVGLALPSLPWGRVCLVHRKCCKIFFDVVYQSSTP